MNSREKILAAVKKNQPALEQLPSLEAIDAIRFENILGQFKMVLETIGGVLMMADNLDQVAAFLFGHYKEGNKYVTTIQELTGIEKITGTEDAHKLEDVEVAVIRGVFGVAENGAIWVTGSAVTTRALPFICQHLVVVLHPDNIVHNMHEAYDRIANDGYTYGVFIAGPSKTADIEQSLVLGAHGARSMTVFLLA